MPAIGNLSAADAPHLVFIQDPVAQTVYTLNLTDKTAQKMPSHFRRTKHFGPDDPRAVRKKIRDPNGGFRTAGWPAAASAAGNMHAKNMSRRRLRAKANTEDLGSQTMEGVQVTGVRTTRTIPVGEIGNDRPISIVTEVWTSPDLKTIVYSKRTDPRMGEQTFQLTNIVRSEPDARCSRSRPISKSWTALAERHLPFKPVARISRRRNRSAKDPRVHFICMREQSKVFVAPASRRRS